TKLSYQEGKCKLYNEFDKFTSIRGESLHEYYLHFAQFINDMHTIGMTMQQVQVNIKFLNALQPEWSKFVTNVKLAKNMYNTNFDQLYAYLSQHEGHENEARMMCDRYPDPFALGQSFASLGTKGNAISSRGTMQLVKQGLLSVITVSVKCIWQGRIPYGQVVQITIPQNVDFQTEDLDTYDSDCDDISSAKAVLTANLLNYETSRPEGHRIAQQKLAIWYY
ncbi:hypothetical protein Tco_1141455, partial [Tanacetum coccineum]